MNFQKVKIELLAVWVVLSLPALSIDGCRLMNRDSSEQFLGGVKIRDVKDDSGLSQPDEAARIIYVRDFKLDAKNLQDDSGVKDMMPEPPHGGLFGRLEQRLPHPFASEDPVSKAKQIVNSMAQALVDQFVAKGMPAQRLSSSEDILPTDGWLVQGMFTEVGEGNRLKRAVIGFGEGATSMQIQVGVSDLASKWPRQPFIMFGTVKDPSKMPGAVVTMNPYVAAAKFVMEKNATDKNIKSSAEQIVDEILKYDQKFKEEAATNRTGK